MFESNLDKRISFLSELLGNKKVAREILNLQNELLLCLRGQKKILICGNGGSSSQSQHMAGEIVGRFSKERRGLPALALTADSSILTAVGNDFGFREIFSRQVEALGERGDLVLVLSTSGNSLNIIQALKTAKQKGLITGGLLGKDGGEALNLTDHPILIPSRDTQIIQEVHLMLIHYLCEVIDNEIAI